MRVLIDIGHPAHVHLFKNLIWELKKRNHIVLVTVKNIPSAIKLLIIYNIDFINIGNKIDSITGKLYSQFYYDYNLFRIAKKNKIDLLLGSSITITHLSAFSNFTSLVFDDDDDEVEPLMVKFAHPFATRVLTPDVLYGKRKKRETIYYPSFHELAYLHPNRFTPDWSVLNAIGLKEGDPFFILRFNAFKAHHDIGIQGLSLENKREIINKLLNFGKVFITTEKDIDDEFKLYQLKVSPEKVHSLIYFATMLIGDSQTMTSEAAVLGTPSIRCNSFVGRIAYLEEEERKYGLTFGFKPNEFVVLNNKLSELLTINNIKSVWKEKRARMLNDKIDSTSFYLWIIENFPNSINQNFKKNFWAQFN